MANDLVNASVRPIQAPGKAAAGVQAQVPVFERQLRSEVEAAGADVFTDLAARGRYATDASMYQILPTAVVVPKTMAAAEAALAVARDHKVPVTARGGGTSQCGQTINTGLIVDCSKHLNRVLDLDVKTARCVVEPGIVLDDLNRSLRKHGLWFPVDVSTASRATIGGMTANNSCGGRSLRYGTTRNNVLSIDATLADGRHAHFGEIAPDLSDVPDSAPHKAILRDMLALGAREADEIRARFPQVQRRVGGYNLDEMVPGKNRINAAHLLVGSEGTLAFSRAIELKLWPVIGAKGLGVCHFGSFHEAMDAAQHIVKLKPIAVELVDRTLLELAGDIAMFRPTLDAFLRGEPDALLLVEFAEDQAENGRRLAQLSELMGDLGFGWDKTGARWGGVVEVLDPALQNGIANLRTSGLNIMMSMKDARKPVSFVEDCAVPLPHLADYTAKLTAVFEKHGTRGTWYAHASEGCLHVRPVLNLKLDVDVKAMRAIAEEAFALVRSYKGSHSGEHGDGIVRSEFHAPMFGERLVRAFEEVKDRFDPQGLMNPGKIVRAPRFDDRTLFRYGPSYRGSDAKPHLDWSDYTGAAGGLQGAVEMCNNNGACRSLEGGVMCPSYRATRDEAHVTRGRANTLRLALSGQLDAAGLASDAVADAMALCVSCKGCRRECPTGVDMARFKIEVLAARREAKGMSVRDRLIAYMPHYARAASRVAWVLNLRDRVPGLAALSEKMIGFSKDRTLPKWRRDVFDPDEMASGPMGGREVVLFADTFNRHFEREKLDAALKVLHAAGCRVHIAAPVDGSSRALCCGRTFLAAGAVDKAREEAVRSLATLAPFAQRGVPIIGLEPSCVFSFRDEIPAMVAGSEAKAVAAQMMLIEEFLARDKAVAAALKEKLKPLMRDVHLHGHCHQKAFGAMGAVEGALKLVPGMKLDVIQSSCCGMAGAFGYQAETAEVSRAMAELSLLPAVRKAKSDAIIVADGTSCRHQIADGAGREAVHVVEVLAEALG